MAYLLAFCDFVVAMTMAMAVHQPQLNLHKVAVPLFLLGMVWSLSVVVNRFIQRAQPDDRVGVLDHLRIVRG